MFLFIQKLRNRFFYHPETITMNVICYICNKQSIVWHQNFTKLKSQYTNTPICEFIKPFLADFDSVRNIDDASNHICIECWQQMNDYDWMKQQTIEREANLRHLLLSTEIDLKNEKITAKDCHNGLAYANGLKNEFDDYGIELEPNTGWEEVDVQPLTPIVPSSTQLPLLHPSISYSMLNDTPNLIPTFQSNSKRTFAEISKPIVEQTQILIRKNGENQTPISNEVLQNGGEIVAATPIDEEMVSSSVDTATTPLMQHHAITNSTTIMKYVKPSFSYACLIAMALKNSYSGSLPVSEIYSFICEHFPYYGETLSEQKL